MSRMFLLIQRSRRACCYGSELTLVCCAVLCCDCHSHSEIIFYEYAIHCVKLRQNNLFISRCNDCINNVARSACNYLSTSPSILRKGGAANRRQEIQFSVL